MIGNGRKKGGDREEGESGGVHEKCLQGLFLSYLREGTPEGVQRAQEGRCPTCRQRFGPVAQALTTRIAGGPQGTRGVRKGLPRVQSPRGMA